MNWSLVSIVFQFKVLKYKKFTSLESSQFSQLGCLALDIFNEIVLIRILFVASNPSQEPFSTLLPSENFLNFVEA